MKFKILSEIGNIELISAGNAIREIRRLRKFYGGKRWRKLKGTGYIKLENGKILKAEIHWYEAHGIGKKEIKIKRLIE